MTSSFQARNIGLTLSEDLFERAKNLLPDGVNNTIRTFESYTFSMQSARRLYTLDFKGNEYVYDCSVYGPLLLGHAYLKTIEAVEAQLQKGVLFGTSEKELGLSELTSSVVQSSEKVC